ncbi:hypothetical protein [Streptomyces sp. NPDC041003]|uniref:hypothetical protein n=1 Tax=Streptomyces sp. NPDC041003 TaxID=3155730 RepID=UPI0033DDF342
MLKLLKEQGSDIPDIAVLEGATRLRTEGAVSRPTRSALGNLADAGAVPILRWGIAPAILLAQKLGLDGWNARLETIEGSLSPVSVWAVWRT